MYTYQQSTGKFSDAAGHELCVGYSGREPWCYEPEMQSAAMRGPIPRGEYTISAAETNPQLGPLAMALTPDASNEMFGRSEFFLHGDNQAMNHTASEGCIILPHAVRERIAAGSDRRLEVVA